MMHEGVHICRITLRITHLEQLNQQPLTHKI
jgi:hypothetical protein